MIMSKIAKSTTASRLAFYANANNLAEVTGFIEVTRASKSPKPAALAMRRLIFSPMVASTMHLIAAANFPITLLKPLITLEKHKYLMDVDHRRSFGQPLTVSAWSAEVKSEPDVLR